MAARERLELLQHSVLRFAVRVHRASRSPGSLVCHSILALNSCSNLEALHDIVKAGKVRYIGASSMHAWQFARALAVSERHGWTRFVGMQNLVNLLYREEEREMFGF